MTKIDAKVRVCKECNSDMAVSRRTCPHCGRPSLFPNVDLANDSPERKKLKDKYVAALDDCNRKGTKVLADDFENACKSSQAVFALNAQKLYREIASGTDVFETYYDIERLKNRTQDGSGLDWGRLRPQAEIELLGDHFNIDQIHYASLSLEGRALNYGDCIVTLSETMISHRATCFEGNTAVLYHEKKTFADLCRSDWQNRHEICVAMFAEQLALGSTPADFPAILVQAGKTSIEDQFVEVHLFGPMTVRTFESVRFDRKKHSSREAIFVDATIDKLSANNVKVI
jgi:hypothetical protein